MKNIKDNKLMNMETIFKKYGLRMTFQRVEIYRELISDFHHPSVEDIYKRVKKKIPTISPDTVYRTISTFENYGLIKRVQALNNQGRFDANLKIHHHLICTRCKRIEDFYWPAFDHMKTPDNLKSWGELDDKYVEIRGLCKQCIQKERKKKKNKN